MLREVRVQAVRAAGDVAGEAVECGEGRGLRGGEAVDGGGKEGAWAMKKILAVAAIEECERVNVRAKIDEAVVRDYAEAYQANAILPPPVIFQEKNCERYIVADGRHRLAAAKKAGLKNLEIDLREGDESDALKFALQCNAEHGLRRTKSDLIHAVGQLMSNGKLSDQYRTHGDRAELMRISTRYFQYLLVEWQKKKPGTRAEAKAQQKAKESAEKKTPKTRRKNTPKSATNGKNQATTRVSEADDEIVHHPESGPKQAASEPQTAGTWSAADEHALKALQREWAGATPAARTKFREQIQH